MLNGPVVSLTLEYSCVAGFVASQEAMTEVPCHPLTALVRFVLKCSSAEEFASMLTLEFCPRSAIIVA